VPRAQAPEVHEQGKSEEIPVYAIVKTGGKQYKVAVGDVVQVEKVAGTAGTTVALPALLVVDGATVTSDAEALAAVTVTGEVVAQTKGPKINIMHYRNKTGYKRRLGHRQKLTQVRVTAIDTGK
jgi:large subunit ribosomal protein L21